MRLKMKAILRSIARTQARPACPPEQAPDHTAAPSKELILDIPPGSARISIEVAAGGLTCAQAQEAITHKTRVITEALIEARLPNPAITLLPPVISWQTAEDNRWLGFWATRDVLVTVTEATLPALTQRIAGAAAINDQRIVFRSAPDSRKVITADATARRQHQDANKARLSPAKSCPSIIFDADSFCLP